MKTITTITLDIEVSAEFKKRGINKSKFFNEVAKERFNLVDDNLDQNRTIDLQLSILEAQLKDLRRIKNNETKKKEEQRQKLIDTGVIRQIGD